MDVMKHLNISDRQHTMIFNQIRLSLQIETSSDTVVLVGSGVDVHESIVRGNRNRSSKIFWQKKCKYPKPWKKCGKTF